MCMCLATQSHKHLRRVKITCCFYSPFALMAAFRQHRPQVIMGFPMGWSGGTVADSDICGEICLLFFFPFHGILPWIKLEISHNRIVVNDKCTVKKILL